MLQNALNRGRVSLRGWFLRRLLCLPVKFLRVEANAMEIIGQEWKSLETGGTPRKSSEIIGGH